MTKLLNTVATRIQTRLSRKALKVALGEIKDYLRANAGNIENITDVEVNAVTEHFINSATKLTVINEDIATGELTEQTETFSSVDVENGNIAEPTQMELETLTSKDVDIVNSVDNTINTASIHDIDSSDLHTNEAVLDTENQTALATATKSELVASTANSLGVILNTSEIELIASNFNSSSEDLTDSLEEIKSAIVAFIQYKVSLNSQKISETLEEISQVAADGFSQNSEQLTTGLQGINSQLQEQTKDFKSKVKSTLAAFKVPNLKAG